MRKPRYVFWMTATGSLFKMFHWSKNLEIKTNSILLCEYPMYLAHTLCH